MNTDRQPITTENFHAHQAQHAAALIAHVSNAAANNPRVVTVAIMGDWLLTRSQPLQEDLEREFTAAEIRNLYPAAKEWAIRHSNDIH